MAITDPTAVDYINGKIRPMANNLAQMYYMSKAIIDEYVERGGTAFIPNSPTEVVDDGADTDGRPIITGRNVTEFGLILINDLVAMLEANGKAKLNQVLAIANRTISLEALPG